MVSELERTDGTARWRGQKTTVRSSEKYTPCAPTPLGRLRVMAQRLGQAAIGALNEVNALRADANQVWSNRGPPTLQGTRSPSSASAAHRRADAAETLTQLVERPKQNHLPGLSQ